MMNTPTVSVKELTGRFSSSGTMRSGRMLKAAEKLALALNTDVIKHIDENESFENEDVYYEKNPQKRETHDCQIFRHLFTIINLMKATKLRTCLCKDWQEIKICTLHLLKHGVSFGTQKR